jgi:23S rRNA pseudouridine2605 synthase
MDARRKKGEGAGSAPHSPGLGPERLHKFLASTGAGSRRECETFIEQGRVSVNGKVVTRLGTKVVPGQDTVHLDGERVLPERKVYYLLNKPPGYVCTNSDERGRARAIDLVPETGGPRVYTVGRLDADSRGLVVLTNDGAITNVLCHPRYRIEKTYEVTVRGAVDPGLATRLEAGVWLAEGKSSPARVNRLGRNPHRDETLLEMTIFEGRNREIRRVLARVGLKVKRLVRTRIGPLELGDQPLGTCRILTPFDLRFVQEAERLYLANREAWDAEFPEPEKPEPARGRRHFAASRRPRQDGEGRPPRGAAAADRRGGRRSSDSGRRNVERREPREPRAATGRPPTRPGGRRRRYYE